MNDGSEKKYNTAIFVKCKRYLYKVQPRNELKKHQYKVDNTENEYDWNTADCHITAPRLVYSLTNTFLITLPLLPWVLQLDSATISMGSLTVYVISLVKFSASGRLRQV